MVLTSTRVPRMTGWPLQIAGLIAIHGREKCTPGHDIGAFRESVAVPLFKSTRAGEVH